MSDVSQALGAAGSIGSAIPFIGPLIGGAATIANMAITSGEQEDKARQLEKAYKRPTRQIAPGVLAAQSIYQNLAQQRMMPGQQTALDNLSGTEAQGIRAINGTADSPAAQLAAISGLHAAHTNAINALGDQAAQWHTNNLQTLAGFDSGTLAGEQNANFQYNKADPYASAAGAASSLRGAAIQNRGQGINSFSNLLANMYRPAAPTTKYEAPHDYWKGQLNGQGQSNTVDFSGPVSMSDGTASNAQPAGPGGFDTSSMMAPTETAQFGNG